MSSSAVPYGHHDSFVRKEHYRGYLALFDAFLCLSEHLGQSIHRHPIVTAEEGRTCSLTLGINTSPEYTHYVGDFPLPFLVVDGCTEFPPSAQPQPECIPVVVRARQ